MITYDHKLLLDIKERTMSPDMVLYIGNTKGVDPDKFKSRYLGRTPKGGYYTTLGDLEGLIRNSKIGIERATYVGPGYADRSISEQLNIAYKGMQFIKAKWDPFNEERTYYCFICKDQDMGFITHIKKSKMAYSVIDKVLTNKSFKRIKSIRTETNGKIVHIYMNLHMVVSVLTDEEYFNSIRIFFIGEFGRWCHTGKTTLLFQTDKPLIGDLVDAKIHPRDLLQMDISTVPIESWDFHTWWEKVKTPSIMDDSRSSWEFLLKFLSEDEE